MKIQDILLPALIFVFWAAMAEGYVISHNRVVYAPDSTAYFQNFTMYKPSNLSSEPVHKAVVPDSLVLDKALLAELMDCRPKDGSSGYQSGYDDACDWMRDKLGIKTSNFASRPPSGLSAPLTGYENKLLIPIEPGNYVSFNMSTHGIDLLRVRDWSVNDAKCLINWSESRRFQYYNLTYYDDGRNETNRFYNVSWDNVTYYRTRYDNLTYARSWTNASFGDDEYMLRVYLKK